ncbi:MAG: hypothetical protein ABI586_02310 [Candidatus Nanopelagicales bacterium]
MGFLLDYSADPLAVARKSADYVVRVLSGTQPSDLPIDQVATFDLSLNQTTAKAIQLKNPKTLLLRVTKVLN